ncbi:MAG TPA: DUF58 domain-containing protein [Candidatus Binatia bacterium]|jgi:uncharacterized protein (DUF58 family)|nr:DUF58 domain-containing protein [Candidatus Binatia bacterium]
MPRPVPRSRLLLWVALVVLPFGLLAGIEPSASFFSLLAIGLFLAVALADAVGACHGLVGITLQLPAVARMSKDRETKLEVRIRNEGQKPKLLRLALALPRQIQSRQEETDIALPGQTEWSRLAWPCLPVERGNFQLEAACVETGSPFGFWGVRKMLAARSEIRVYPNLFRERRDLAALFLHRGTIGVHTQRQVGQGREFEKLREYIPGDSFDEIHWKATAKRGRPVTKVFQLERTQEIYVVIDASRLSARPVESSNLQPSTPDLQPATTLERFITAALVLGLVAEQQGDLFGLVTFTDKIERFIRARNGQSHFNACRDALYRLQPQLVTPDYSEICSFIRLRLRRRALLVFLTALDDAVLAESFVGNLDLIRRQHLVLVNMLQPPGVAPLFSDPGVGAVDDLYERLGGHLLWRKLRELEKVLQRRGVRFSLLRNERLSAQLLSQYLDVKRRQAL